MTSSIETGHARPLVPLVLGALSVLFAVGLLFSSCAQSTIDRQLDELDDQDANLTQFSEAFRLRSAALTQDQTRVLLNTWRGRLFLLKQELAPVLRLLAVGRLAFAASLLLVGSGVLLRRRWARRATIAWASLALLFIGADAIAELKLIAPRLTAVGEAVFLPVVKKSADPEHKRRLPMVFRWINIVRVAQKELSYSVFPVVLLVAFGRRKARAYFEP